MSTTSKSDWLDPIVEEVHQTRRKLLEEHGGIAGLVDYLRQQEAKAATAPKEQAASSTPSPDQSESEVPG